MAPGKDGAANITAGPEGSQGPSGPQGPEGSPGSTGPLGPQGEGGGSGSVGPAGPSGATGAQGAPGAQGATGSAGTDGKSSYLRNIPSLNVTTSLDSNQQGTAAAGYYPATTIGSDGLGLLAYFYCGDFDPDTEACSGGSDLKVAHCSNMDCTSATFTLLDTTGDTGLDISIIVGADGLGLIAYKKEDPHYLKIAHCSNINCTAATITALHTLGEVGESTSITIGADGHGLISYFDGTSEKLKVAH